MSTRAIISIPTAKGFKTAWCWCDGFPSSLGRTLRNKFKTEALANELINYHSFESVMTANEHIDFKKWRKEAKISFDNEKFIKLSNGCFIHMHAHHGKTVTGSGKYGFFRTIKEMLEQDLNYVYVFENGKWKMYK